MKAIKIFAIIVGVIILGIVSFVIFVIVISRTTEKVITSHPLIGEIFTAGAPAFYMEDCNNFASCSDTARDRQVNRSLVCNQLNPTVTPIYNASYPIPADTSFELIELLEIKSHGLDALGGPGYVVAVLRDDNGLLSTILFSDIGGQNQPFGFTDSKICD